MRCLFFSFYMKSYSKLKRIEGSIVEPQAGRIGERSVKSRCTPCQLLNQSLEAHYGQQQLQRSTFSSDVKEMQRRSPIVTVDVAATSQIITHRYPASSKCRVHQLLKHSFDDGQMTVSDICSDWRYLYRWPHSLHSFR